MKPHHATENLSVKTTFFSPLVTRRPAVSFPAVILSDTGDIKNVKEMLKSIINYSVRHSEIYFLIIGITLLDQGKKKRIKAKRT